MGSAIAVPSTELLSGLPVSAQVEELVRIRPVAFDDDAFLLRPQRLRDVSVFFDVLKQSASSAPVKVPPLVEIVNSRRQIGNRQAAATLRVYIAAADHDDLSADTWPGFTKTKRICRRVISADGKSCYGDAVVKLDNASRVATCVICDKTPGVFALGATPSASVIKTLFQRAQDLARVILAAISIMDTRWGNTPEWATCEPVIRVDALRCMQIWSPSISSTLCAPKRGFGEAWWAMLANAVSSRLRAATTCRVQLLHDDADCEEAQKVRAHGHVAAVARTLMPRE